MVDFYTKKLTLFNLISDDPNDTTIFVDHLSEADMKQIVANTNKEISDRQRILKMCASRGSAVDKRPITFGRLIGR